MNQGTAVLLLLAMMVLVLLFCRELACWYFKLNRIVELLERMVKLQEQQQAPMAAEQRQAMRSQDV